VQEFRVGCVFGDFVDLSAVDVDAAAGEGDERQMVHLQEITQSLDAAEFIDGL
jgi:hypothetical protein